MIKILILIFIQFIEIKSELIDLRKNISQERNERNERIYLKENALTKLKDDLFETQKNESNKNKEVVEGKYQL